MSNNPTRILVPAYNIDPTKNRIVFIGDSGTEGTGCANPELQSYPALIAQYFFLRNIGYKVVNSSYNGDTTDGVLKRIDKELDARTTFLIVLEIGTNDIRFTRPPLFEVRERLSHIIEKTVSSGIGLVLVRMNFPVFDEYIGRFVAMYDDLARLYHIPLVDYVIPGVIFRPETRDPEGHFNEIGHREIAHIMLRQLNPAFTPSLEELTISDSTLRVLPWLEHVWEQKRDKKP